MFNIGAMRSKNRSLGVINGSGIAPPVPNDLTKTAYEMVSLKPFVTSSTS